MAEIPLRRWLQKQPQPSLVIADMADGTEKKVRIGVARSRYRDAEEALKGAVSCEALNEDGESLRTWESGAAKPVVAPVDGKVAEGQLLVQLANVLAQVQRDAVQQYAAVMQQSHDQNAKLLGLVSGRLAAIEKLYHSSLIAQAEALAEEQAAAQEAAEQANDPNMPLVAQVLQQALSAGGMNGGAKETE